MTLMRELLSDYNDNLPSHRLVESMSKLLDDNIYNENADAICYYKISRRIACALSAVMMAFCATSCKIPGSTGKGTAKEDVC